MPENFGWVKRHWLNRMIPYSSRVAAVVVCPSRFTADRLVERLGIPSEKIRVVPHGHDPVDRAESAGVMGERLGSRRFVLYPAIAYAHKRHGDVVAAVAALPKSCDDLQVVFTGRPGPETGNLRAQAAALGLGRRVHFTGRLPEAELDWLYRNAQAMVFPSAYEGFGNPAVEAMSRGCPVIVSDAGALPEVVGSAGLVIPVGDVTALTVAIGDTVGDNERARCLRASGLQRARGFATSIASKTLLAVYRDALQQPPPP
jgi:glycosyltransferase involved in cell wall biosynthesis